MLQKIIDYLLGHIDSLGNFITTIVSVLRRSKKKKLMFKNLLLQAIKGAATEELRHLFEKFAEKNGADKAAELEAAVKNSFTLLRDVVADTKTKVDDTLVDIVLQSLPSAE
jgi:hypothetical protein